VCIRTIDEYLTNVGSEMTLRAPSAPSSQKGKYRKISWLFSHVWYSTMLLLLSAIIMQVPIAGTPL
jgi:hypothetical protein